MLTTSTQFSAFVRRPTPLVRPNPAKVSCAVNPWSLTRMSSSTIPPRITRHPIPILLLKTRSQPDDTYEECFRTTSATISSNGESSNSFAPHFIPVLEHTQNEAALSELGDLLRSRRLKQRYGGVIFTSQRAVEAWADVVAKVNIEPSLAPPTLPELDAFSDIDSLTSFAVYVVGPATQRAVQTLINSSDQNFNQASPFTLLNPSIHGAHTGNGATLATFILGHYNYLYGCHWFEYFEAPRLPFIPLLGMSSQNYGRKRLEKDDPRLAKKPLLFLVGEVRRDVIPKTLSGAAGSSRIDVDEVEVYRTEVMKSFEGDFAATCERLNKEAKSETGDDIRVVVVFSPQGSDIMLKSIGYLDATGQATDSAMSRWYQQRSEEIPGAIAAKPKWILVTIGPTTRDYLQDKFGIEPDVCAAKPSPEGLRQGIEAFLKDIEDISRGTR